MKKGILAFFMFLCLISGLQAQKIKYKDLYPQLHPSYTDESVQLLKTYLSDEKNQDEGNPNYLMGEIYFDLYQEVSPLVDTATLFRYADSSQGFYAKALELIDEKEIKRNSEYYQNFYRRDLRTGEFGIKLSDVHLAIETNQKLIEKKNQVVKEIHALLASMAQTSESLVNSFNAMIGSQPSREQFLFNLNDESRAQFRTLKDYQYQLDEKDKQIVALLAEIESPGLLPPLELVSIPLYTSIDITFNPLAGGYNQWDIDTWVTDIQNTYEREIEGYQSAVLKWDETLDFVEERLESGNASNIDIDPIPGIAAAAAKYDTEKAMIDFLRIKSRFLLKRMITDTLVNPDWSDSSLVSMHAMIADSSLNLLQSIEPILPGLSDRLKSQQDFFVDHIDKLYGGVSALTKQVSTWQKELPIQIEEWQAASDYWQKRNNWTVWEKDSIALKPELAVEGLRYHTLRVDQFKDGSVNAFGFDAKSSAAFATHAMPDRNASWLFEQPLVEDLTIAVDSLELMTVQSPDTMIVYYQFYMTDSIPNLMITKLSNDGQKVWSTAIPDAKKPDHVAWNDVIDQYTLYYYPEESYPLADGSSGYVIVDQNGEIK